MQKPEKQGASCLRHIINLYLLGAGRYCLHHAAPVNTAVVVAANSRKAAYSLAVSTMLVLVKASLFQLMALVDTPRQHRKASDATEQNQIVMKVGHNNAL